MVSRDTVLKWSARPGKIIGLALLVLAPLLPAAMQPAPAEAQATTGGYWQQTSMDTDVKKSDDTHTYSVSNGSATQTIVAPDVGDRFVSTATWSSPKASYQAGEIVELTLLVRIDEYVWNGKNDGYIHPGLNHVGDSVLARIDVTGLGAGGVTAGAINLTDADGEYIFSVDTDNGTQVIALAGRTVSAPFPAGSRSGDLKSIRVVSQSGVARYNYTWVAEGDTPPAVQTTSSTTSAPITYPNATTTSNPPWFEDSGARFSNLDKEVEVIFPIGLKEDGTFDYGDAYPHFATMDQVIPVGTRILTGEDSTAILAFLDMSTFVLRPESEIVITKAVNKTLLEVVAGRTWLNVKKALSGGTMEVETSHCVVGSRGTTFVTEDDGTTSTVKVIEGTVEVTFKADGKSELVNAAEKLSATADGLGEIETFDAEAEQAEWEALMADMGYEQDEGGFPLWLLILIIVIAAALLAAVATFLILRSRKRQTYGQQPMAAGQPLAPGQAPVQTAQSAQPMATDWYYLGPGAAGGRQVGPLTWVQLYALAQAGSLTPNTMVWNPALPQWVPAGQISGLFSNTG